MWGCHVEDSWSFFALAVLGGSLLSAKADAQTNFGSVNVGSSATETVTVTIPSAATFTKISVVTMGATGLDFSPAGTGTCVVNVAYMANQTCTVGVTFKPLYAGFRMGAVTLLNSSTGVYATTFVYGSGNGPQLAFVAGQATAFSPTLDGFPIAQASGIAIDGTNEIYIASQVDDQSGTNIASTGVLQIPAGGGAATVLPALVRKETTWSIRSPSGWTVLVIESSTTAVIKATMSPEPSRYRPVPV